MKRGACNSASDGRRAHNRAVRENQLRYGSAYAVSGANALALQAGERNNAPTLRLAPKLFPICRGLLWVETVDKPFGQHSYVVFIGSRTSLRWSEARLVKFWATMHKIFEWEATDTTGIKAAAPHLLPAPPALLMITARAST